MVLSTPLTRINGVRAVLRAAVYAIEWARMDSTDVWFTRIA